MLAEFKKNNENVCDRNHWAGVSFLGKFSYIKTQNRKGNSQVAHKKSGRIGDVEIIEPNMKEEKTRKYPLRYWSRIIKATVEVKVITDQHCRLINNP